MAMLAEFNISAGANSSAATPQRSREVIVGFIGVSRSDEPKIGGGCGSALPKLNESPQF
jgi:hypothetical protein